MIRSGFEPGKVNPGDASDFAVGDEEDEEPTSQSTEDGDQSRKRSQEQDRTSASATSPYEELDDRHVWSGHDS